MKASDWAQIKFFKPTEAWGDVSKISFALVRELDSFRAYIDIPIQITCGTQGTHVEDSQHYLGLAVDVVFPSIDKKDLFDIYLAASRFGFKGIGVYPFWRPQGGLHLDIRDTPMRHQWLARKIADKQYYVNLCSSELRKDGVI